jgi:hypothetical protein
MRIVRNLRGGGKHAVIALVLCLATAGTATAAKLITGADVKNSSLTGRDVKDRSLTPRDFKGSVKGERGAEGPAGSAVAYAKVVVTTENGQPNYQLDREHSKNVNAVARTGSGGSNPEIPGIVCVDVDVPVNVAVVTADRLPVEPAVIANVQMPTINGADRCPGGTDAAVILKDTNDNPAESSFYVIFN